MEVSLNIKQGPSISAETLEKLAKQAEAKGITPDDHVAKILDAAAETPEPQLTTV